MSYCIISQLPFHYPYKPFTLSELAEALPSGLKKRRHTIPSNREYIGLRPFEETLVQYSRNCSLFHSTRFYAYSIVSGCGSYEQLYKAVLDRIVYLNDIEIPKYFPIKLMDVSELRSIARSVASRTWEHRSLFRQINKGAMQFPSMRGKYLEWEDFEAEVRRRRRLSAERTHRIREEATIGKIRTAVELCLKNGLELTISNISRMARVSRPTLYKYMGEVASVKYGLSEVYTYPTSW